MQDYYELLKIFNPIKNEKYIEITVPVDMGINDSLLILRVVPLKQGYVVCDNGKNFSELNNSPKYYFDLFMEKDTNDHFSIEFKNNIILKKYPENFNVRMAISEFVRYFIYLDDYLINNNII